MLLTDFVPAQGLQVGIGVETDSEVTEKTRNSLDFSFGSSLRGVFDFFWQAGQTTD